MKERRYGEFVTLALSLLIIGLVAGYLIVGMLKKGNSEKLSFSTEILWEDVSVGKGAYVLPISVSNLGDRTATEVQLAVKAPEESTEVKLKYLSQKAPQKVYLLLKEKPAPENLTVKVLYYRLE